MTRILVVDDNEEVRELCADYLSSRGYDVTQAADGEEALAAVFSERPGLIIMDLDMPVMDGWTAIRILKRDARTEDVPIIVVTGHATQTRLCAAHEAGAAAVLTKPSNLRALDVAIAHALRRESESHELTVQWASGGSRE